MTVVEAADLFVAALRGRYTPLNTIKAYASDLRRFAGAMPPDLATLDAAAIRAFLDGDAADAATRRRRYAALCSLYHWLVRQEIVDVNPMERVDRVATVSLVWHTEHLWEAVAELARRGQMVPEEVWSHITPLHWEQVHLVGRYQFNERDTGAGLRPLRRREG